MDLFLVKVYRNSKPLFILFVLFVLGQIFFSAKMVQTFPFFNYGMYSAPQPRYETYTALQIDVNDEKFDPYEYQGFAIDFMYSNLWEYRKLQEHDWVDPNEKTVRKRFEGNVSDATLEDLLTQLTIQRDDIDNFMPWLTKHISKVYDKPIRKIVIKQIVLGYTAKMEYQKWGENIIATYQPKSN